MNRSYLAAILALVVGRGITPPFAFAQAANESRLKTQPSIKLRLEDGRLLVVAFRDGLPAGGITLEGKFGVLTTRPDGTLSANLPPGPYKARIPALDQEIQFTIVADEETQITLQVLEKSKGQAALSEPEKKLANNNSQPVKLRPLSVQILAESTGKPIGDASIIVAGQEEIIKTDAQGVATVMIAADSDSFTVFHPKFQSSTVAEAGKKWTDGKGSLRLKDAANELEEVVVLAPKIKGSVSALVEVRRQSSAVTDVLGSEQMARAGDSDAASSLRRVTGLTLMNGKYVYVRGLGERYSGVQMNQFGLPSPEPARRVVPLDLFPTSILESIVVQKSYSPDLPGEFGGGVIQLQTRSLPEKFFFKTSLSTTIEDTDNRLTYRGGVTDWMGIDDGSRKLPSAIEDALSSGRKLQRKQPGSDDGMSDEELTRLGRSIKNNYATSRTSKTPPPNMTISAGDRFRAGASQFGVAGSVLYGQSVDSREKIQRGYNVGSGTLVNDFAETAEDSETEIRLAGSLDLGWQFRKHHNVNFSTFLLRHTTDFVEESRRTNEGSPSTIEQTTLEWTERQLWTKHFKGKHNLENLIQSPVEISWRAGFADATRNSPARREYAYERTATSYDMRSDSGGNSRRDSKLTDATQEFGVDVVIPLSSQPDRLKLKVGANTVTRDRRSDVFRLFFRQDWSGAGPIAPGAAPEDRFKPENIGPGGYMLQSLTDAADSYKGRQNVNAQYAMLDYSPWKTWSFQAGARAENSVQKVSTFKYFEPENPSSESTLKMNDVLPAYSVVWKPNDQWRARLAYSETLARPEFREMSIARFIDDETGNEVEGNAFLKGTVITNIDHRWEYYFTSDEYASVGGFMKRFENPIEVMFISGVNKIQTWDNAKAAENYGAEFEARVGLRHVSRVLRRWSVLGNYTWIRSKIELDERNRGIQTSDSRPLQGQAPYTTNFQLQYDRPLWGFSATLLYNIVGSRITEVGTNQLPDTYERPYHQVDFVASKSIAKNMTVGLRARNLLDPVVEARQDNQIVRSFRRGRSMGVSLNAVF